MYEFQWPTKTLFDPGLIERIGEYIVPTASGQRLLLVAPREPWAQPLIDGIAEQLHRAGWETVERFAQVEPNPSWETVKRGAERARSIRSCAVFAIGGGSTMDAGKVIAQHSEADLLCTAPTTAGTGGEISAWAVISDTENRAKDSVVAKWPDLALLDPRLTLTLPRLPTLFTGLDAFIHGVEAYVSSAATPITDALALAGLELIAHHLRGAVEQGDSLEARSQMLQGSLLTGAAMLHAGLGLMHAIGNVTGGLYHQLPHGLILMRCMEPVLTYNRPAIERKLAHIQPMIDRVRRDVAPMFEQRRVPAVEIAAADVALLVERAIANVNAETNPRPATPDVVEELVREAFTVCH